MLTDIFSKGIELLVAGRSRTAGRAFGQPVADDAVGLPGVMSRKNRSPPSYWPRPRADLCVENLHTQRVATARDCGL
jgi:hypothetical protein